MKNGECGNFRFWKDDQESRYNTEDGQLLEVNHVTHESRTSKNPRNRSRRRDRTLSLDKKLWEIRQRSIAEGTNFLTEPELEQELANRRGGR